jgi:hypothetical protein
MTTARAWPRSLRGVVCFGFVASVNLSEVLVGAHGRFTFGLHAIISAASLVRKSTAAGNKQMQLYTTVS